MPTNEKEGERARPAGAGISADQRKPPLSTMPDIGFALASILNAGELSTACRKASIDFQSVDAVENGNNSAWLLGSNISVIPASSSVSPPAVSLGVTCLSTLSLKAVAQPSDQPP
jgi:hypothetical protein